MVAMVGMVGMVATLKIFKRNGAGEAPLAFLLAEVLKGHMGVSVCIVSVCERGKGRYDNETRAKEC